MSELGARLWKRADAHCIPLRAAIEITLRCNLRCVHCYNFDRERPRPPVPPEAELSDDEILDAIDQLAEAGCLYLAFTGGEALLHPSLPAFLERARERRFVVRIKTNGMLLTPPRVRALAEARVSAVDVSVYGARAATHDAVTARPGSFERTVRGLRHARAAGIALKVNACLVQENVGEVAGMRALAAELGAGFALNPFLSARYDGTRSSLLKRVDRQALLDLYRGPLADVVAEGGYVPERSARCACARTNCGISATGEVYPCIGAPVPCGNLRERSFAEIWESSPAMRRIRGLRLDDLPDCRGCADRPFCKRSTGTVYTNTGDVTASEPFFCMEAAVTREVHPQGAKHERA